jgi:hypothetical protein
MTYTANGHRPPPNSTSSEIGCQNLSSHTNKQLKKRESDSGRIRQNKTANVHTRSPQTSGNRRLVVLTSDFNADNPFTGRKEESHSRRRKPREGIRDLLNHCMNMSVLSSKACEESSSRSPDSASLEAMLLNALRHQVVAMDVVLSGELHATCKLLLLGILHISRSVYTLRSTSGGNVIKGNETFRGKADELSITISNALTSLEAPQKNDVLKRQFLQLQFRALLVTSLTPGTCPFSKAVENLILLVESMLEEDYSPQLSQLEWEDENYHFRTLYWKVMNEIYFGRNDKAAQGMDGEKPFFGSSQNFEFFDSAQANPCEDGVRTPADQDSSCRKNTDKSGKTCFSEQGSDMSSSAPEPEPGSSSGPNTRTGKKDSKSGGTGSLERRRFRPPAELMIDMTNHVLHLNNFKYLYIWKHATKSEDDEEGSNLDLLLNVLKHQIAVLDIVLSSELYSTASLLVFGMYDTVCSIMKSISHRLYDSDGNPSETQSPEPETSLQLGSTRTKSILLGLRFCQKILNSRKGNSQLKYILIKLQLEALVLTQCSADNDMFREHLELLGGECLNAARQFKQKWWTKYFSLNWDVALGGEEQVCQAYWMVMEANFVDCGLH